MDSSLSTAGTLRLALTLTLRQPLRKAPHNPYQRDAVSGNI